ncbi:hypothetical protein A3Q56_07045 [Intoshia linei]|uniref:Uncharacterized protein n=1 Tax=Intoshia linei TaxID=1819745 RepID=A0A177ATC3_9BILA|nr:hypothetical protein A3Q56_07045 [Intoshia linei]
MQIFSLRLVKRIFPFKRLKNLLSTTSGSQAVKGLKVWKPCSKSKH